MKISVVSYLNSKPFIHGLEQHPVPGAEISLDIPSECARKLITGEANVGLIPVAALRSISDYRIITPFCIGAEGKVDSVKMYSQVPLDQITRVVLDYQSRTSVALVRILAKELWKIQPEWIGGSTGYEQEISGTQAAVVIGDRTFSLNGTYNFEYDLSEAWHTLTGLPFVFAVWISRGEVSPDFEQTFSAALAEGLASMETVISTNQALYPGVDVRHYLTRSISYALTDKKREAIALFLHKLA